MDAHRTTVAGLLAALGAVAVGGAACGSSEDSSGGGCNTALVFGGDRYAVHTDLVDAPVGRSLGTADEVGCDADGAVLGTTEVHAVTGVSPDDAIAVVGPVDGDDGERSVYVYLDVALPRDRAPEGWTAPLPDGAFE